MRIIGGASMKADLYRLSSFPKGDIGGNPAGVVLDADLLSDAEMQEIATEVNYSETAFVSNSTVADFKVRFFTPVNEVDLCGHATIATFNLLRDLNIIEVGHYTQETKAGILQLDVQAEFVYMQQKDPYFSKILAPEDIKNCFHNDGYINEAFPIIIVSTGIREIFLPIQSVALLNQLSPDLNEIIRVSKQYNVIGIHAFSLSDKDYFACGRNFAPLVGIDEESATGTSNGALSCYLNKYVDGKQFQFVLGQGESMNLPSVIHGKLEKTKDDRLEVWVGGTARII